MTRSIVLHAAARRDLAQITAHSVEQWGADRTADYLADLQRALHRAAENPESTSDRSLVMAGLRKVSAGSHAAYFFFDTEQLSVVRILHGRQDLTTKGLGPRGP